MSQPKPIRWQLDADEKRFTQGVKRAEASFKDLEQAARRTDRAADVDVDVDDSELDLLRRRLREARRDLLNDLEVNVDVDRVKVVTQIQTIERKLKALDRLDVRPEVKVDVDRNLGRTIAGGLARQLSGVQRVVADGVGSAISGGVRSASANPAIGAAMGAGILAAAAAASPVIIAGVGATIGAAVTKGMADAGEKLLTAYADIEVANARAEAVFGAQLDIIDEWARSLSSKAGIGAQELTALASSVQDLLVPQGFSRAEAAGITTEIVERGLAMAAFYNTNPADAIDAVTKALLGERDALKSMGVSISQQEVNQWIEDNASKLVGLSDAQKTTTATTELLAQKTADASRKFEEGGNSAQEMLNKWNAFKDNLRTDAIEGFGQVFVSVLQDIQRNLDLDFDSNGLKQWIAENQTQLRVFVAQVVEAGANAALMALQFSKALLQLVGPAMSAGQAILLAAEATTYLAQAIAGPANLLPGVRDMFTDVRSGIDTAQEGLGNFQGAWETLGPEMVGAVDSGIGALTELRDGVSLTRQQLEDLDGTMVTIKAALDENDRTTVIRKLNEVSDQELEAIIDVTENGTTAVDEKINRMARRERRARVQVEDRGSAAATGAKIDRIAREQRRAPINAFPANVDSTRRTLDGLARPRNARITVWWAAGNRAPAPGGGYQTPFGLVAPGEGPAVARLARQTIPRAPRAGQLADAPATQAQVIAAAQQSGRSVFAPTIINNYPAPERSSDAISTSLRVARYLVGEAS